MTGRGDDRRGEVVSFDEAVGLGEVEAGGQRWRFHCTQIADGTRTIAQGTPVRFRVVPARHGTWEAIEVLPEGRPPR